jgi:outer membrane protein assembly factor BamB/predicted phosphohydrolase
MKRNLSFSLRWLFVLALVLISAMSLSAIKIAVLSDIHVTPGNVNDGKLRIAVDEINHSDAALVVLSGDLTNEGSDVQLHNVKSILDGLTKPIFVIPGNHEDTWSQSACKTFNDIWGNDRFVTETDSLVIVGINCGPYMKMGDGHIKQEDLSWLDTTLSERVKNGKRVLSFCHYPILDDLDNCNDYIRVLAKYPVIGHICGHYHAFKQYRNGDIDGLVCRSLTMDDTYGYSVLDISADSVNLFDKQLGLAPALKFAYRIDTDITPLPAVEPVHYALPSNVGISLVHRDEASIFTRVGVDRQNLYIGNSLGYVKAIDKLTGNVKWQFKTGTAVFSRPVPAKNAVIVPTADKRILWLDKATGKVLFSHDSNGPYVADGVISKGILFQGGFKVFQAWNVADARLLWQYDSIFNYCQAAPSVNGKDVAFGAWDTNLRVLNLKTGKLKWSWNNGRTANMLGPGDCVPAITRDKVIIVAPDRYMTALDRTTGKQIWRSNKYKVRESLGLSADGKRVYAKTMDGELIAVSTEGDTFNPLWCVDAGLGYEHAPCIVLEHGGVVYVGSRRGMLVAVDPVAQKVLWRYSLGTSEVNGFEVDERGDIYVSLIEGTVWRIHVSK